MCTPRGGNVAAAGTAPVPSTSSSPVICGWLWPSCALNTGAPLMPAYWFAVPEIEVLTGPSQIGKRNFLPAASAPASAWIWRCRLCTHQFAVSSANDASRSRTGNVTATMISTPPRWSLITRLILMTGRKRGCRRR